MSSKTCVDIDSPASRHHKRGGRKSWTETWRPHLHPDSDSSWRLKRCEECAPLTPWHELWPDGGLFMNFGQMADFSSPSKRMPQWSTCHRPSPSTVSACLLQLCLWRGASLGSHGTLNRFFLLLSLTGIFVLLDELGVVPAAPGRLDSATVDRGRGGLRRCTWRGRGRRWRLEGEGGEHCCFAVGPLVAALSFFESRPCWPWSARTPRRR